MQRGSCHIWLPLLFALLFEAAAALVPPSPGLSLLATGRRDEPPIHQLRPGLPTPDQSSFRYTSNALAGKAKRTEAEAAAEAAASELRAALAAAREEGLGKSSEVAAAEKALADLEWQRKEAKKVAVKRGKLRKEVESLTAMKDDTVNATLLKAALLKAQAVLGTSQEDAALLTAAQIKLEAAAWFALPLADRLEKASLAFGREACSPPADRGKWACQKISDKEMLKRSRAIGEASCNHPTLRDGDQAEKPPLQNALRSETAKNFCRYPPPFDLRESEDGRGFRSAQFEFPEKLFNLTAIQEENFGELAVVNLDMNLFRSNIATCGEFWLIEFYVHWCPHCMSVMPKFYKLAVALRSMGAKLRIGAVNCATQKELCGAFRVIGHPLAAFFYPAGGNPSGQVQLFEYAGKDVRVNTALNYLKAHRNPAWDAGLPEGMEPQRHLFSAEATNDLIRLLPEEYRPTDAVMRWLGNASSAGAGVVCPEKRPWYDAAKKRPQSAAEGPGSEQNGSETEEQEEGEEDEEEGDRRTEAELENHEELAAIQVQTATVLQRLGGEEALKKAGSLYNAVLKPRSSKEGEIDVTVKAVACNNLVALRPEGKSLFDSLKRLDIASKDSLEHKLTRKQAMEIAINKCLALLQARKLDAAKIELQKLTADFKGHPRVAVVQAAVAFKEKKAKGAEEVLQAYLTEHPGSEEALICLAQLHAQQNRYKDAAEALDQLPRASRANPRTAEVVVAFHQRQKNPDKAVACLRDAISYWSGKDGGEEDEDMLAQVLRIASRLAIQLKDKAFAAEAFQLYLERVDGSDVEALCGLVQALASVDPQRAAEYAQRLQVPDYAHLDPEELENGTIPKYAHMVKRGADGDAQKDQQAKKKKKRKPKYPKNYDPANPGPAPDPERWLPKRERTEFKKKMRKKDKNLARGPQGSMVVDEKALRKTGPSTAQVELSSDAASRPKGTKTKKGKK
mmetsp:Transcript_10442/g.32680  ORF Transcript_10442/g.32680 Transcript_10442/m.32680 type:complete len:964 (-) Transcript_10442:105-2996(-)